MAAQGADDPEKALTAGAVLDVDARAVTVGGVVAHGLSQLEFRFIEALNSAAPAAVSTGSLGDAVWGEGRWDSYMVYNLARRVRARLSAAGLPADAVFVSDAGGGYRMIAIARSTRPDSEATAGEPALRARPGKGRLLIAMAGCLAAGVLLGVFLDSALLARDASRPRSDDERNSVSGAPILGVTVTPTGLIPPATGAISGTVRDAGGRPFARVQVTACNERTPDPCPHVLTASDGGFVLPVEPGVYVVSFSVPGQSVPSRSIPLAMGSSIEVALGD